jgi:MFS family permease
LFNSSDVFLLLKAKEAGLSDTYVIGIYIFYNLIYALFAFPLGILADKIGLKKMLSFGIGLFAVVYFGMAINRNSFIFVGLFFLYGIYAAASEGVSKAWISNITDTKDTATAIGTYSAFQSVFTMLASTTAGLIWYQFGSNTTFIVTASASVLILVYFLFITRET